VSQDIVTAMTKAAPMEVPAQARAGGSAEHAEPIPSVDLKAQYRALKREIDAAIARVMESQHFILGPEVTAFEQKLAEYVGTRHAIGVASGSDALLLALMALDVGPGDEVITTPYTFFATAGSIARLGAKPVFVDIELRTFNLDPDQVAAYLDGKHPLLNDRGRFDHDPRRVKAIIPVHLYGQCADMAPLLDLARERAFPIIEDAAQAIGSRYQGHTAGTMGLLSCLSFFPSKNLGAAGDAGAVVTDDGELAEKVRVLRAHGSKPKYFHPLVGMNSRLDALQAAILAVKLTYLDRWSEGRQQAAARYDRLLRDGALQLPWQRPGDRHIFNQYIVRSPARDALQAALKAASIGCEIYYPLPMHLQQCFADLGYRPGDLPQSEAAAKETLALPMYPELSEAQQRRIAGVLRRALSS
jgi:dTDP-4-amino-4,6-dideoxygalactose transaminase